MMTEPSATGTGFNRRAIPAAAVESYWQASDRHPIRRVDWPEPELDVRGSILFLPGRVDFFEKYLETLDGWSRAGWKVTSSDWRGQGFSGRMGRNRQTGHIHDFSQWIDDLGDFWEDWVATVPPPHVIIGHSMGGQNVLRALSEKRIDPDAAVLVAPMLGLVPRLVPMSVAHLIARVMVRIGDPARSAWRGGDKPGKLPEDRFELLTHDPDRYADEMWWRQERPDLSMTAPSWGWVERAIASMRLLRRPGALEAIGLPVLCLAVSDDGLVDPRAIVKAVARIGQGELFMFGRESRHEILREVDAVRDKALAVIDEFLDRTAPVCR